MAFAFGGGVDFNPRSVSLGPGQNNRIPYINNIDWMRPWPITRAPRGLRSRSTLMAAQRKELSIRRTKDHPPMFLAPKLFARQGLAPMTLLTGRTWRHTPGGQFTRAACSATRQASPFSGMGSNGGQGQPSQVFKIGRDDGSVYGPSPAGSPFVVNGLAASTTCFFCPYFDERLTKIVFPTAPGAVGSPAVAFTSSNFQAAQQQLLRGHIPLARALSSTGVTTTASGSVSGSAGGGGGAGGGL